MAKKDAFKLEPTELNLRFSTPDGSSGTWYIDLARALSVVNRRFYRQGYQYAVADIQFLSQETGTIAITRLPTTWTVSNSWMKVMSAWDRQQKDALREASALSTASKYRDFKIALNSDHASNWQLADPPGAPTVLTGVLQPLDYDANAYGSGDWEYSEVAIPNPSTGATTEFSLHMVGADTATSKGMVKAYQESRARVPEYDDPREDNPQNSFLSAMFNDGGADDEVVANATDTNDQAPYEVTNYPGGDTNATGLTVHDYVNITQQASPGASGIQTAYGRGGVFPCGLMAVTWTPDVAANLTIVVRMVPGTYRGVHAEHMKEM